MPRGWVGGLRFGFGTGEEEQDDTQVLNIERVEAGRTCSSWREGGCGDGG